jgi:hypothetical protein
MEKSFVITTFKCLRYDYIIKVKYQVLTVFCRKTFFYAPYHGNNIYI